MIPPPKKEFLKRFSDSEVKNGRRKGVGEETEVTHKAPVYPGAQRHSPV